MNIQTNKTIGELVAQDYRLAAVFKKLNIDFCCNGNRTLNTVSKEIGCDTAVLINELNEVGNTSKSNDIDFQSWSVDLLAEYIEKKHHKYVREKIEQIKPYLTKITTVHGDRHPELVQVSELFDESAEDLTEHMKKEEKILFPFIKNLAEMKGENINVTEKVIGSIENPIGVMHQDHDIEGERFRQIAKLTNNYTLPADGCNTYRVTLALLKEFEDDLHLHIHLENNILFPKAIQLEKELYMN